MRIYKKDVRDTLRTLEKEVFGESFDISDQFMTKRMENLFIELYLKDIHPIGVQLIKDSYNLLQTKGFYYTDEE